MKCPRAWCRGRFRVANVVQFPGVTVRHRVCDACGVRGKTTESAPNPATLRGVRDRR